MALITSIKKTTPSTVKKVVYSDFYPNFNTQAVKKDLLVVENEQSVISSIKNILQTSRGERFFNSLLGSDVNKMLFENFSTQTADIVKDMIKVAIKNNEPRAQVIDIQVTTSPDEHSMFISVLFNVINKSEPVTLELVLNRIR